MKKITAKQVQSLKTKRLDARYGKQTRMIADLKIGEGLLVKIDKNKSSTRNKWHEYAMRSGMKVKTFKTNDRFLVVERVK